MASKKRSKQKASAKAVRVGTGSVVLSNGRELPIRVEIVVAGRSLTRKEDRELESTRVALHDLGMVEFLPTERDLREGRS